MAKKTYVYNIENSSSKTTSKTLLIDDALKNNLYVNKATYLMKYLLRDFSANPHYAKDVKLSICYHEGKAVGIALYYPCSYHTLQVFVKARHRNRGIAKSLIKDVLSLLDEKDKRKIKVGEGNKNCCQLWCSLVENKILNKNHFDEYDVMERQRETLKVEDFIKKNKVLNKVI